jgi:putative lipoic acid-binding regulatory protein
VAWEVDVALWRRPCRVQDNAPPQENRWMSFAFDDERPEIAYPCRWEYKAIGSDREMMETAILEIVEDLDYTLDFSNASRTGKYCSLLLVVTVDSEEHRNSIFQALRAHPDIRMVL